MREQGHRTASIVVRELWVGIASVLAAWLFLNHEILYLGPAYAPRAVPAAAYALTVAITYAFLRGLILVAAWRMPHRQLSPDVCPECGQPLEDGTPTRVRIRTPSAPDLPSAAHRAVADARALRLPHVHALPGAPIANLADGSGRDRFA